VRKDSFVYAKTEKEADLLVRHTVATLAFEGMIVTDDEQKMLKKLAMGEIRYEDYLQQVTKGNFDDFCKQVLEGDS